MQYPLSPRLSSQCTKGALACCVRLSAAILASLMCLSVLHAQTESDAGPPIGPVHYRAEPNHFIQMRDGIRLATDLYIPEGAPSDKFPVVLIRTPYGNLATGFHQRGVKFFASHGYVVAVQEKRGKFRSEGVYSASGGDADDGYDTIDWLSKQSWSNGRVGTWGCSYLGDVQIFLAQTKHPALKAMIPQSSGSAVGSAAGLYRQFAAHEGGAVFWAPLIGWFAENGQKIVPKLPTTLDRDTYTADYAAFDKAPKSPVIDYPRAWYHLPMKDALKDQGIPPTDFEDTVTKPLTDAYWAGFPYMTDTYTSDVPALFVNGWYDFGADLTLFEYNWFRTHSVSAQARDNQYVLMGPGVHCSMDRPASAETFVGSRPVGDARFDYWQAYLTWFDYWLKSDPAARKEIDQWPKVRYYELGANKWRSAQAWPVAASRGVDFYLSSKGHANSLFGDGTLSLAPASDRMAVRASSDSFTYDPATPVPSLGGAMCCTGSAEVKEGSQDQRPVEARQDVLVFTTATLSDGIHVTGSPELILYVSSSAVDTDFTAKLVDVYPDGRAFNVTEKILRARYREGLDKTVWMQSGEVYELRIPLGDTSNYFGPGHKIRLEVSSSNFPLFSRNLNIGGNNEEETRWVVANNVVYHSLQHQSRLILPTLTP